MIKFNNKDMTDLFPVKIEDIAVSPVRLSPVARQRATGAGAVFVRQHVGTRTVTISFALLDMDIDNREQTMLDLEAWAYTETEKTLVLPQFDTRHLECICTQFPDHSYRKWWENKLRLVFTCFDNPFWTSNDLIEVKCGATFSVGGTAPPLMTIERNGSSVLRSQVYATKSESMTFDTIPGGALVIDLNRQTAAIGKTSIMQYYLPSSKWITPKVGANQYITGNGVVKYRERWV